MRGWPLAAAFVLLAASGAAAAQSQPLAPLDPSGHAVREDLAAAGDLAGAKRVLRFVQVSDAHILDDDAPYPLRQEPLDAGGPPFTAAQRPQEEYTDEVLASIVQAINALHAQDPLDLVINTGDNIDNELENELMRFLDLWEGTSTLTGPVSGLVCVPDGQSTSVDDATHDEADRCTGLPPDLAARPLPLAPGLPWLSAFGNHDGLVQGNVPLQPGFNDVAGQHGRRFLTQEEYVGMHFAAGACVAGAPGGGPADDWGHGYGHAGERLCDADPENDGYYAFSLRGVRFVVLDTVNDDFVAGNQNLQGLFSPQESLGYDLLGGYAEGSVDPVQFEWLADEVASHPGELVLVFAHHTVNSMFLEPASSQCGPPGCLRDLLGAAGYKTATEVTALLAGAPNVVAFLGGHTHQHRIQAKTAPGAPHGFWNVESASLIDAPQEARAVELWVTADGAKGVLALTGFGHAFNLSRELAATDPQADPAAPGTELDRDVLLWFDVPPGVAPVPMPEPVRDFRLRLAQPQAAPDGLHGRAGGRLEVAVELADLLHPDAPRPAASATWSVRHVPPPREGRPALAEAVDIPDGTPMEARGGNGTAPWAFGAAFTPAEEATHYATVRVVDAAGGLLASETFSLRVAGDGGEPAPPRDSPSAPLALAVAGVALAALLGRRR